MKRISALTAAVIMCGVLVSGCQKKEEPKPAPAEQKAAGEQAPAKKAPTKKAPVGC